MKCNSCGTEFDGNYCPICGAPSTNNDVENANANPEATQMKTCPVCHQQYNGNFCPHGCGVINNGKAKKKLKGWKVALIVTGSVVAFFLLFGIVISFFADSSYGFYKLEKYEWGEVVENRLKSIGVEEIRNVYVKTSPNNPNIIKDLDIETEKNKLSLLITNNIDNWDVIEISDYNDYKIIYYVSDTISKDEKGRYLYNIYDYKSGKLINKADEAAIIEKQERDKRFEEEQKKEAERLKKEEEERKKKEQQTQFNNYIKDCKQIDYKELARYPDKYKGTKIKIKVEISQILEDGLFTEGGYRGYENGSINKEWFVDFKLGDGAAKILQDDIVIFYGEYDGTTEVKRALTGTKEQIPTLKAQYSQISSN